MTMSADTPFAAFRSRAQLLLSAALPDHITRLTWDRDQIAHHQRSALRAMLTAAIEGSAFHARRLRGLQPDSVELADLASLPPMTKTELMEHFDEVVTDPRMTRARCERVIETTRAEPQVLDEEAVVLTSGGSSGERGVFLWDAFSVATFAASVMRPAVARLAAAGVGPTRERPIEIAMVAAGSAIHATRLACYVMEGSPVRFIAVPVTQPLEDVVAQLNALQPRLLYGYPSVLACLAREQVAGRLGIAPIAVTTTSETLRPDQREAIRDAFEVPIGNTFGSSEGLVGVGAPDDEGIVFADDCCIIELVDDDDRPVPTGTPSSSVLVTNLYNRVQPLIRYRLDDRFVQLENAPSDGHLRASVEGRTADVLRFDGVEVHPLAITTLLARTPAIADYQVRQTLGGVAIEAMCGDGEIDRLAVERDVCARLKELGLPEPEVVLTVVDRLDRNPNTGKRATFVPLTRV
jgi:phenylacetate-CoA ligase